MLEQVSALMDKAPVAVDYQFDVFSDGRLGPTFAIDVQFGIEQPETVLETFEGGAGADIMRLLEGWSAADDRWKVAVRSAFACAIPVELADGGVDMFAFALMPRWVKARWTDGTLQPAKLYQLAHAGVFEAA